MRRIESLKATGLLTLSLLSLFLCAFPSLAQTPEEIVPGELLIGLKPAADGPVAVESLAQIAPFAPEIGDIVGIQKRLRVVRMKLRPGVSLEDAGQALRRRPDVLYVEPNHIRRAVSTPNDTFYASKQYAPQKTQANLAWDFWSPQAKSVIAIVDTGVKYTHPDLMSKILTDASGVVGYNAVDGTTNAQDDHGHGTHCAGIAAANINNAEGVAGIAGWNPNIPGASDFIKIMPVKVLASNGSGSDAGVADGIVWATDHGANVISMSLGGPDTSDTLENAVKYAAARNVLVVAAAGNSGSPNKFYPAAYSDALSVAATDSADKLASFSNYGPWVKVAAPGNAIYSTYPSGYATMSGTSMACPCVAGEAILIHAHNPALTGAQIVDIIESNVDAYTPFATGKLIAAGAGRINVYRALLASGTGKPTLLALSLQKTAFIGGTSTTGTIYLNGPAPAGGVAIALYATSTSVKPPSKIIIAAGGMTGSFTLDSTAVGVSKSIVLTAAESSRKKTVTLTLLPPTLTNLTLTATKVAGGSTVTGTVTLDNPAPVTKIVIPLTYSTKTGISVTAPTMVVVESGQKQGTFSVKTIPVVASSVVSITAKFGSVSRVATLTVAPTALSSIIVSPASVAAGGVSTGRVTLTGNAPAGGVSVAVSSDDPATVVPATVKIPANANFITFPITAPPVAAAKNVTLTASYDVLTKTAILTVRPADVATLTLTPSSVKGGATVMAKVTLTANVLVATPVAITTTNTAATVPALITVPANANSVTVTIATKSPGATKAVGTVTAKKGTITKSVTLTVTP